MVSVHKMAGIIYKSCINGGVGICQGYGSRGLKSLVRGLKMQAGGMLARYV